MRIGRCVGGFFKAIAIFALATPLFGGDGASNQEDRCKYNSLPLSYVEVSLSRFLSAPPLSTREKFEEQLNDCVERKGESLEEGFEFILSAWTKSSSNFPKFVNDLQEFSGQSDSDVYKIHLADILLLFSTKGNDEAREKAITILNQVDGALSRQRDYLLFIDDFNAGFSKDAGEFQNITDALEFAEQKMFASCRTLYSTMVLELGAGVEISEAAEASIFDRLKQSEDEGIFECPAALPVFCAFSNARQTSKECRKLTLAIDVPNDPFWNNYLSVIENISKTKLRKAAEND